MADRRHVGVTMELQDGYRFLVDFDQDGVPPMVMDDPELLGEGAGPKRVREGIGVDVAVEPIGAEVEA